MTHSLSFLSNDYLNFGVLFTQIYYRASKLWKKVNESHKLNLWYVSAAILVLFVVVLFKANISAWWVFHSVQISRHANSLLSCSCFTMTAKLKSFSYSSCILNIQLCLKCLFQAFTKYLPKFSQKTDDWWCLKAKYLAKNTSGTLTPSDISLRLPYPLSTIITPHEWIICNEFLMSRFSVTASHHLSFTVSSEVAIDD